MKAITFLEWYKQETTLINTNINYKEILCWNRVALFYSQPFEPKMITGLFENVDVDDVGEVKGLNYTIWEQDNSRFGHIACWTGDIYGIITHTGNSHVEFPKPLTLDHFISDCTRAGIELTFKKEIQDKYFK